jgi:DNA polymerase-3 subunit theta
MSGNFINLAALTQEEKDRVNVDMAAAAVAYKMRLRMPVIPEVEMRKQPEALQPYFMDRYHHHLANGQQLPGIDDPRYTEMAEANKK